MTIRCKYFSFSVPIFAAIKLALKHTPEHKKCEQVVVSAAFMKTMIKAIKSGIALNMLTFECYDFLVVVAFVAIIVNCMSRISKTMAIVLHNGNGKFKE